MDEAVEDRMEQISRSGLLDRVTSLVDALARDKTLEGAGDASCHMDVAREAMEAAIRAEREVASLTQRVAYLEKLAMTDELTGLLNRRGFQDELSRVLSSASRYGEQGVLVYVDLDGFKPINDTYGHLAGDEVLIRVAQLLGENTRATDYVGRLGGDEFAILLTRTDWDGGLIRAELLEKLLNSSFVSWDGRMIAIRASFGLQGYGAHDNAFDLLGRADQAMYETKRLRSDLSGRSQLPAE
ncbi:MAG: GGDEF domain-containing protein [Magnetovibrionaceae bacterium]